MADEVRKRGIEEAEIHDLLGEAAALAKVSPTITLRIELVERLGRELLATNQLCERLQTQLGGCLRAAEGAATGKNDCERGSYGWSLAFERTKQLRRDYDRLWSEHGQP